MDFIKCNFYAFLTQDKGSKWPATDNFLYSDISDQMIEVGYYVETIYSFQLYSKITCEKALRCYCIDFQNPSPAEPPYVASARLQILTEQRSNGQLRDDECRMLVDSFMWSLTHIDKVEFHTVISVKSLKVVHSQSISRKNSVTMLKWHCCNLVKEILTRV